MQPLGWHPRGKGGQEHNTEGEYVRGAGSERSLNQKKCSAGSLGRRSTIIQGLEVGIDYNAKTFVEVILGMTGSSG